MQSFAKMTCVHENPDISQIPTINDCFKDFFKEKLTQFLCQHSRKQFNQKYRQPIEVDMDNFFFILYFIQCFAVF